MEATKVKTILEWEMPKNERMFRSSMDFATSTADMYKDIPKLLDPSHG